MRFLLTNDDGIDAAGLAALERAARELGQTAVVAPRDAHSGCSHVVTVHRPLAITEVAARRRHIDGTPADCTRVGLLHLHPETDWVLSGINAGGNLGADVYLSGTVAAVREAALFGRPGIAFSHYKRRDRDFDWDRVVPWVRSIIRELTSRPHTPRTFWNVNLPHIGPGDPDPPVVECHTDPNPLGVRYEVNGDGLRYAGDYHGRPREPGSDIDVCFSDKIACALVRLI
jgi:5'-nucleotidase